MVFLKSLLLATILSIATAEETTCPAGWLPNTFHGTKCCSGNMVIDEDGAYCCVYDMRLYKEALTNTALLYETATTTSTGDSDWSTLSDSCVAKVRFTASDYSAQVSSAASKAEATPTTTSMSTTTADSSASSGASAETSTPTSNAAMPLATAQDVVLGGAAIAAGLFML